MSFTHNTDAGIDGDIVLYRVGFACQHTEYSVYLQGEEAAGRLASFPNKTELNAWLKEREGDEYTITDFTWTEPIENALHSAKLMVENILDKTAAGSYCMYLSGINNFRTKLLPSYKAGRKPRPLLYEPIKEYLMTRFNTVLTEGIEADDALGIRQMNNPNHSIICSIDKDLLMIPGKHYNFVKDEFCEISEEEGSFNFDCQMLTGDSTDNICGIKGLGPVRASVMLEGKSPAERQEVIRAEYQKYWGEQWEEVYDCNSKLLWILREPHEDDSSR